MSNATILQGDCIAVMRTLPEQSINLVVTSPPYNAGMDYGERVNDLRPWPEYETWAQEWVQGATRLLIPGGRICINTAAVIGRSPAYSLATCYELAARSAGLLPRGMIVWDKGAERCNSTVWGSYCSSSNPCLRDCHEVIQVWSKDDWRLPNPRDEKSDLQPEEFQEWTRSVWRIGCEKSEDHPAPFTEKLAGRLIKLYSWPNDIILDPFMGSGTVAVTAEKLNRRWLGIEINVDFISSANKRIRTCTEQARLEL